MLLKKTSLSACLFLCFILPTFAEDVSSFDLGKVVVSQDQTPAIPSATKINLQDIESRGTQTTDAALDFISGVRLTVGQKNEPYVVIRGFNQDEILILLDGIPIASPYYGYVDLNQIPIESIAEIEVVKAAASSLYGANTLGGVVSIVSKSPGEKPYLEINSGLANNRTRIFSLNYGSTINEIFKLWVSGAQRKSDGFDLSEKFAAQRNEDGDKRDNSYYEKNSLALKLGLEQEDYSLTALFNYFDNEKGIPVDVFTNRPRFWRFTEWQRWLAALAGELEISDHLSLKGRLFYDQYDNTLDAYDDAAYTTQALASSWTSSYDEHAIGSSVYLFYRPDDIHFLKGALNFKRDVHKEQDDTDEPWERYKTNTYSLGLEDEIRLNERLSITTGISYDLFRQIKNSEGNKGDNIDAFNPTFALSYNLDAQSQFYVSASKKTLFPTMNQLYSQISGNPDLKEQKNISAETGLRRHFQDLVMELSYFYNNVQDLIERSSRDDPYLNISKAVFEGVEANLEARLGKYLAGRLSYTHLACRNKNPEILGRTEKELSYLPDHKADAELKLTTDLGFALSLLGSYHGRRYYYDSNNLQHTLGGYFVWNLKLAQEIYQNWQISLFIENILDRNYQEEEGYPQPGRNFLFNIKGVF